MNQSELNGRLKDIIVGKGVNSFPRVDQDVEHDMYNKEALKGIQQDSPLSKLFFSKTNIDALQEGIRYSVYKATNGKFVIGRQSDDELKVIMRSYYLQFSQNLQYELIEQIKELNGLVLDYCVQQVMSGVTSYSGYLRDIQMLPYPMDLPQTTSIYGTKSSEFKEF